MSTINEQIVTGRAHRVLIDKATKLWQRKSFWTKGSDVEFNDGKNAETKVGAIKGITIDLNTTETGYAADMTALAQLNSEIADGISVRYNKESDSIELLINGIWTFWRAANTRRKYLIQNGQPVGMTFSPQNYYNITESSFNFIGNGHELYIESSAIDAEGFTKITCDASGAGTGSFGFQFGGASYVYMDAEYRHSKTVTIGSGTPKLYFRNTYNTTFPIYNVYFEP